MFDFLKEIVETIPDPSAGDTIDLEEAGEGTKKKRGGKAKKNGAASGEPKRRRKRKATNAEPPEAAEQGGTEAEGDAAMDEDDDKEAGESGHRHQGGQDGDWQEDEDTPYVPR